jgi:hypothetical protein
MRVRTLLLLTTLFLILLSLVSASQAAITGVTVDDEMMDQSAALLPTGHGAR